MYMYDNTIFNNSTCKHVYPVIRAHKRQFANVDLGKKDSTSVASRTYLARSV